MMEGGEGERGGGYEDLESLEVVRWWWSSGMSVFWSKSNSADHIFRNGSTMMQCRQLLTDVNNCLSQISATIVRSSQIAIERYSQT